MDHGFCIMMAAVKMIKIILSWPADKMIKIILSWNDVEICVINMWRP